MIILLYYIDIIIDIIQYTSNIDHSSHFSKEQVIDEKTQFCFLNQYNSSVAMLLAKHIVMCIA